MAHKIKHNAPNNRTIQKREAKKTGIHNDTTQCERNMVLWFWGKETFAIAMTTLERGCGLVDRLVGLLPDSHNYNVLVFRSTADLSIESGYWNTSIFAISLVRFID